MYPHDDFPCLPGGRLLYLRDPQRLTVAGRQLGQRWSFRHPVHHLVPVVSAREFAEDVFDAGLPLAGADRFLDWLGTSNPLRPLMYKAVRAAVLEQVEKIAAEGDPNYHARTALRPFADRLGDVGPALRDAALGWMLDAVCRADQQTIRGIHAVAISWQRAAATIPLLLPSLRGWSCRYSELGAAKLRLLGAIADCRPPAEFNGSLGPYLAGTYLTLLGPVVDALPMVAMSALTFRDAHFARRIERAIKNASAF